MTLPIRKTHHLVFQRRAVARADAGNLPVVEGRLRDMRLDQVMHCRGGVQLMADDLWPVDPVGQEREGDRRLVAACLLEAAELDAGAVEAGRRPGLEPPPANP